MLREQMVLLSLLEAQQLAGDRLDSPAPTALRTRAAAAQTTEEDLCLPFFLVCDPQLYSASFESVLQQERRWSGARKASARALPVSTPAGYGLRSGSPATSGLPLQRNCPVSRSP